MFLEIKEQSAATSEKTANHFSEFRLAKVVGSSGQDESVSWEERQKIRQQRDDDWGREGDDGEAYPDERVEPDLKDRIEEALGIR